MPNYTISSFEEIEKLGAFRRKIRIKDTNGEVYIGYIYLSPFRQQIEEIILENINNSQNTEYTKLVGITFANNKETFPSAFKYFYKGEKIFYNHRVTEVIVRKHHYQIKSEIDGEAHSSRDNAIWVYSSEEINDLLKQIGRNIDNLVGYEFQSKYKYFDDAWNRHIFGIIKEEDIEDKIIVPALANIAHPDQNQYEYKYLDRYFDEIVFGTKELVKITKYKWNNYYDSTKWLKRIQAKIPNVNLTPILDENKYDIKPRGSSYWYITATKDGSEHAAIMGFGKNFITWIEDNFSRH